MGSGITIINADVNSDVGCSYYRHPLGITTDVTPLKIVGLNNYRRLQGDKLAQVAQVCGEGSFGASCAKSPRWCTMVSKEDKIAQLAQFSKVGAGQNRPL